MEASVLPDSCFYISRLRNGRDPFQELARYAETTDFYICGVVMVEVMRGLRVPKHRQHVREVMESMIYVATPNRFWEDLIEFSNELDRLGANMHVPDMIIAQCALQLDAAVLTLDSDFYRVPGLRVLDALW